MSYGFYVYTDRASIATTKVYSSTSQGTYAYAYGSGQQHMEGFSDGSYLKFTAEPTDGYEFYRWVYHIGEIDLDNPLYSDSHPFIYYGNTGEDIYIAAEGKLIDSTEPEEPDDSDWSLVYTEWSDYLKYKITETIYLFPYDLYVYRMRFNTSGTAQFYTTGSVDTIGWLGESLDWNTDMGEPNDILVYDDESDDSGNFFISWDVDAWTSDSPKYYYLWVRGCFGTEQGQPILHVVPPTSGTSVSKWSWTTSNGSASATETSAAYSAVLYKQITTNFSHKVWNDLVDKVNAILVAKGLSWDTYYATLSSTKMNSAPYELTAVKFNSLRNNLKFVYDSGISKVDQGDDVLGSYFITLAQSINNAIDNL